MVDASTQCEGLQTMDAQCQFPKDASEAALADHTYFISVPQTVLEEEEEEEIGSQYSQMDLFPGLGEDEVIVGDTLNEVEAMKEEEPMEVVMSQETTSSQSEFILSDCSYSQDEASSSQESSITPDNTSLKQRVFLVYEEKLKELLRFCPICGSLIISENTVETSNEGTQLSLTLNCMGSCTYKWQSQPPLQDSKGAGNL